MELKERTLSAENQIYPGVVLGKDALIETPCILGKPPRGKQAGEQTVNIGEQCVIRPFTTIYAGVTVGDLFQTGQGVSIREDNIIGDSVSIGTNSVLEHGNKIGNRVRIHTGCFLEMVIIEDDVFIGANVVFTDDPHPPCPKYKECKGGATVKSRAKIGANSTILPGIMIGEGAVVGAGSVVTKDVPAGTVVAGNPARIMKVVDQLNCDKGFYAKPYDWE